MCIKVFRREEIPCLFRLNRGIIGPNDALPRVADIVYPALAEVGLPFLLDKLGISHVGRRRQNGNHMDALNSLYIRVKVGGMVDLVLEQNPGYLVPDKLLRLDSVVLAIQVVILQASCNNRQLEVAPKTSLRLSEKPAGSLSC